MAWIRPEKSAAAGLDGFHQGQDIAVDEGLGEQGALDHGQDTDHNGNDHHDQVGANTFFSPQTPAPAPGSAWGAPAWVWGPSLRRPVRFLPFLPSVITPFVKVAVSAGLGFVDILVDGGWFSAGSHGCQTR